MRPGVCRILYEEHEGSDDKKQCHRKHVGNEPLRVKESMRVAREEGPTRENDAH